MRTSRINHSLMVHDLRGPYESSGTGLVLSCMIYDTVTWQFIQYD